MTALTLPARNATRRQSFTVVLAIELWERFGFYGMQAVLTIYLVSRLGLQDYDANLMIGAFSAMTYVTPVLGGMVGDRLLGSRRSMVGGAVALALGYMMLGIADQSRTLLYLAMAVIATGNGLFKPNAGNLVRRIYEGDDAEVDAAFTIYYMSVNVGSTVSMLLTPWLQDRYGPGAAFMACALGLVLGLIYYAWRAPWLKGVGGHLDLAPVNRRALALVSGGALACVAVTIVILSNAALARLSIWLAAAGIAIGWIALYRRIPGRERPGLRLAYLLCLETMVYALFYQQQQTSLTLFALRAVDGDFRIGPMRLFHWSAGQFQALNSLWIMVASPVLAFLYDRLGQRGRDLSLANKMAIGFSLVVIGFFIWWRAAAAAVGLVSPWVMVVGYGFTSVAELLTMGLGLAVIARYVPTRLSGFMMGSLYLVWALAMYVGSVIANIATATPGHGAAAYVGLLRDLFFLALAAFAAVVALLPIAAKWARQCEE